MPKNAESIPWWASLWVSVFFGAAGAAAAQVAPYRWLESTLCPSEFSARIWSGIGVAVLFFLIGVVATWIARWSLAKARSSPRPGDAEAAELHSEEQLLFALESTLKMFESAVGRLHREVDGEKDPCRRNQQAHYRSAKRKADYDYLQLGVHLLCHSLMRAGWDERIRRRTDLQLQLEAVVRILKPRWSRDPEAVTAKAARRTRQLLKEVRKELLVLEGIKTGGY